MPDTMPLVAVVSALLGLVFFLSGLVALTKRRLFRMTVRLTVALLLLAVAGLLGVLAFATQGYSALTREEVAALVRVEPAGPKRFNARFRFPEGREASYTLAGDELYVDAHILKWKPIANLLGLHTAYELDRVAGRYRAVAEEQAAMRTVYALAPERPVDLFELRQRYSLLSPLLDVEYGSATFVVADEVAEFEIRVSTTGLMARRLQVKAN